ncbi:ferritin-like domain-containing protein [Streptomyces sp. NPDC056255]|uniref:ferritin-like domain-containing protein n=1 Tax=Streptomyces sp. NPDC056255 TaxID=3345764 RepID=UPI0035DB5ADE
MVATEVVCRLRYSRHTVSATGIDRARVTAEFTEHAAEEIQHTMRAAERIAQLGGEPDFDPATSSSAPTPTTPHASRSTLRPGDWAACRGNSQTAAPP